MDGQKLQELKEINIEHEVVIVSAIVGIVFIIGILIISIGG